MLTNSDNKLNIGIPTLLSFTQLIHIYNGDQNMSSSEKGRYLQIVIKGENNTETGSPYN